MRKTSRRVIGMILCLTMVLLLLPAQAMAADAAAVSVQTEAELTAALESGAANVVLGADITLSKTLTITKAVVLDLGGHTITMPKYTYTGNPDTDATYGVIVQAPDAAVTICNGTWESRGKSDIMACVRHEEGTLTLTDLNIHAVFGVDVRASVERIENCEITSWGCMYDGEKEVGVSINVTLGGEVATIKNCTIENSIFALDEEYYEMQLTSEYKTQDPEGYARIEGKLQEVKASGRRSGSIGTMEDCEITCVEEYQSGIVLMPGSSVELIKGVRISSKDLDMSGISTWRAKVGTIQDCTIDVTGKTWACGLELHGYEIGTISGLNAKVTTTEKESTGGLINSCEKSNKSINDMRYCGFCGEQPILWKCNN